MVIMGHIVPPATAEKVSKQTELPIEKRQEFSPVIVNFTPVQLDEKEIKKAPEKKFPLSVNLEEIFEKYARNLGVESNLLKKIAKCESGFNASSNGGVYGGMFQFSAGTWRSTRSEMGLDPNPDLRFDAEESIKTSAFKISRGGIGAWPVCSR